MEVTDIKVVYYYAVREELREVDTKRSQGGRRQRQHGFAGQAIAQLPNFKDLKNDATERYVHVSKAKYVHSICTI